MGYGFSQKQAYRKAYSAVRKKKLLQDFPEIMFNRSVKGLNLNLKRRATGEEFEIYYNKSPYASNGTNFLYPVINRKDNGKWKTICGMNNIGHCKKIKEYVY